MLSNSDAEALLEFTIPVTPTITKGCAAKMENTMDPRMEERSTSLTPKLIAVFENMSKEKASAGRILRGGLVGSFAYLHLVQLARHVLLCIRNEASVGETAPQCVEI